MLNLWSAGRAPPAERVVGDEDNRDGDLESGLRRRNSDSDSEASTSLSSLCPSPEERRRMERELVLRYDSRELKRGDAWFLVETSWLDAWMTYILSDDDPDCPVVKPGPLTNYSLFDPKEFCLKKGLEATKHYRGVNPAVYALYAELYGTSGAKPIVRWTLDIYATPVMIDDVKEMLRGPELRARVEVAELNDRFDVSPRPDRGNDEAWLYRCCCRCEFLIPCLGRLLIGPTYAKNRALKKKNKRSKKLRRKKKRQYKVNDSRDEESSSDEDPDSDVSSDAEAQYSEARGLLG